MTPRPLLVLGAVVLGVLVLVGVDVDALKLLAIGVILAALAVVVP